MIGQRKASMLQKCVAADSKEFFLQIWSNLVIGIGCGSNVGSMGGGRYVKLRRHA